MAEKRKLLDDPVEKVKKAQRRWQHDEICSLLEFAKEVDLASQTGSIATRNKPVLEAVTKRLKNKGYDDISWYVLIQKLQVS